MENKTGNNNYLYQANYLTESILSDVTEVQKDIIYFLQTKIDFYTENPSDTIIFNYDDFLNSKSRIKNNTYSVDEMFSICKKLASINGIFFNKVTSQTIFFNILDNVTVNSDNPNEFNLKLASFGKVFFYKKHLIEYANSSKIQYTQIEKSIISLKGDKRKKLYELLSQYKSKGLYIVSLEKLKVLLGFIVYKNSANEETTEPVQLNLIFEDDFNTESYSKVEYFKSWSEFKRNFLDPAIDDFNSNTSLDISKISYTLTKKGRKVVGLSFSFIPKKNKETLTEAELTAVKYFLDLGLTEKQIIFLLQRIGYKEMYKRLADAITFNNNFSNDKSPNAKRKIWFTNDTKEEIVNIGGYLYEKVFHELKN